MLTSTLKTAVVPSTAGRELLRNIILIAISGSVLWILSALLIKLGGFQGVASATLVDPLASKTRL